jgi:phosphotransferase system HPr (HPr) family protein
MPDLELTVIDPVGLHARPAARFVQVAARFVSRVVVRFEGREANAKSLSALLGLTLRPGSRISLSADGPDAAAALVALGAELAPYVQAADSTIEPAAVRPAVAGLDQ